MAKDTAGGGLKQLENHYNSFIVRIARLLFVVISSDLRLDGGRFCANRRRRAQLDQTACRVQRIRCRGWRGRVLRSSLRTVSSLPAVPWGRRVDLCAEGVRMGAKVRPANQLRHTYYARYYTRFPVSSV